MSSLSQLLLPLLVFKYHLHELQFLILSAYLSPYILKLTLHIFDFLLDLIQKLWVHEKQILLPYVFIDLLLLFQLLLENAAHMLHFTKLDFIL